MKDPNTMKQPYQRLFNDIQWQLDWCSQSIAEADKAELSFPITQEYYNKLKDTSKTPSGIGLRNISNRTQFYNGTVQILSSPGNGCTLEVTIPL